MDRWEELFEMRDRHREEIRTARPVVRFSETAWELNRQGRMKWYLHPNIRDTAHRALILYVQEIPPGSRSGRMKTQGGIDFFIWKGRGHSIINDKRYDWEAEDLLLTPINVDDGNIWQHFNDDPERPALIVCPMPNVVESLGVDLGVGFEQLEDCPEWTAQMAARAG